MNFLRNHFPRFLLVLVFAALGAVLCALLIPGENRAVAQQLLGFPDSDVQAHQARPLVLAALCFLPALACLIYSLGGTLSALLRIGGLQLVVVSRRDQARDPVQFEMLGIDPGRVRSLVLKSRGHFRAAFDEFFSDDRIVEVDVPGLTTPVLANVAWERMPRPVYPLDPDMAWSPPD